MSDTTPEAPAADVPPTDPIDIVAEGQVSVARDVIARANVANHPRVIEFEEALKGATTRSEVLNLTRTIILAIQAWEIVRTDVVA